MRNPNELQDAAAPDRVGAITASNLLNAFKGPKGRRSYVLSKATQRLSKKLTPVPETFAMIRGREMEAEAKDALEEATGIGIIDVPFIPHPRIPNFGASPDGIWADKSGLVEIKCPSTDSKHTATIVDEEIDPAYRMQMLAQVSVMFADGYKSVDFVSYYPDLRDQGLHLAHVKFEPTLAEIMELEEKVTKLDQEINQMIEEIRRKHEQSNIARKRRA